MYETLQKKMVGIAEKYADLIDAKIAEAALAREANKPSIEIGGTLHEISDGIRILHHAIAALERLNRIDAGTSNTTQSNATW